MVAYIKFGGYNKNYKYIIFTCIFNCLSYYTINGYLNEDILSKKKNPEDSGDNGDSRDKGDIEALYIHPFINDIFNYIGIIFISIILYKCREKKSNINKKSNEKNNNIEKNSSEILLIHNDIKDGINKNISLLNLFFILSYWVFIDHITKIIQPLLIFDYWMFELLFISLMASIILKTKIYRHQKSGIIINSLFCLIFGLIRFIIFSNENNNLNMKYKYWIPISIIFYLFIINSTSYIYTKLKFYMDLKFISQAKLLILYGIIGFVLSTIACIIETSFECVGSEKEFFCNVYNTSIIFEERTIETIITNETIINNETIMHNETIITNETIIHNETNIKYIENFLIFIKEFSILDLKDRIIEIVIFIIGVIFYYCSLYFDMLIINYLTPMHFIFSSLIYLFLSKLIELIRKNIKTRQFFNKEDIIYYYDFSAYIFSFIGFMIYLEIIELNFCNLNYNLRKYINKRSIEDIYEDNNDESTIRESDITYRSSLNDYVEMPTNNK